MEYVFNVYKLLSKCFWYKLSSSVKVTLILLLVMILGSLFYFGYDILYQLFLQRM